MDHTEWLQCEEELTVNAHGANGRIGRGADADCRVRLRYRGAHERPIGVEEGHLQGPSMAVLRASSSSPRGGWLDTADETDCLLGKAGWRKN